MIYKEKHTELELAINNMRKMIRGQQNYWFIQNIE